MHRAVKLMVLVCRRSLRVTHFITQSPGGVLVLISLVAVRWAGLVEGWVILILISLCNLLDVHWLEKQVLLRLFIVTLIHSRYGTLYDTTAVICVVVALPAWLTYLLRLSSSRAAGHAHWAAACRHDDRSDASVSASFRVLRSRSQSFWNVLLHVFLGQPLLHVPPAGVHCNAILECRRLGRRRMWPAKRTVFCYYVV